MKTPKLATARTPPRSPVLAFRSDVESDSDDDRPTSEAQSDHRRSPGPARSVASSSSTGSDDSRLEDDIIWSYIRNLQGVIGVLYQPMLTSHQLPSLGVLADEYLRAHGYTPPAIDVIVVTAKSSESVEVFVDALTMHGFAQTEAKFLWDIIDHEADQ